MDTPVIGPVLPQTTLLNAPPKPDSPERIRDAAEQFESLLINQILHSAREAGGGWLSLGGDAAGDSATDFAEQTLAQTLAQQGGLGLSRIIAAGLQRESSR
jgi:Rod binding domain-containing protein